MTAPPPAALFHRRTHHFHTESFGAFFGLLYVCIAAVLPPTVRLRHIALLAVPLLLSVGTKEPFVLPLLASTLLLRPGWRGVRDVFVLPLLAAAAIGIVLLGILGMLRAYAGTYLPYMLLEHQQLVSARVDLLPFPLRGFHVPAYIQGLLSPPQFVVPVALLWAVAFLRNATEGWKGIAVVTVSLWLVILAAEMAERNAHQQVIAVPACAALLLTALSFWTEGWTSGRRRLWQGAFACALVPPLLLAPSPPSQGALAQAGRDDRRVRQAAAEVDRVLDACGMERYVVLSVLEDQIYAYTEHSPLPMGLLQHIFRQNIGLDTFRADMRRSMEQTEVLLLRDGDLLIPEIARYVQDYFTVSPPTCAGDISLPEPMVLLFRERPHGSVPGS